MPTSSGPQSSAAGDAGRLAAHPEHVAHAEHGHACDCAGHRRAAHAGAKGGIWASLSPLLVCAVCPACLAAYTKVLSVVGISVGLSEFQHTLLLVGAISVSLAVSASRSRRMKRAWPLLVASLGSLLVLAGHFLGELHSVEWAGVLTLLAGGVTEQVRLRRANAQPVFT